MKLIVLFRHGLTQWNIEHRYQGRKDIELSPLGRQKLSATQVPECLRKAVIYSSPLKRARQTAEHLGWVPFCVDERLIEVNFGHWEGLTTIEVKKQLILNLGPLDADSLSGPDGMALSWGGLDGAPPGGESPRQVRARLNDWLTEIEKQPSEIALAITHKGVIRNFYSLATGWNFQSSPKDNLDWTCFQLFWLSNGRLSVCELNCLGKNMQNFISETP